MSKIIKFANVQSVPVLINKQQQLTEQVDVIDGSVARDLVVSAHSEAVAIIAEAEEKAASLLREAAKETEEIKSRAHEEGHRAGYAKGYAQGIEEGKQKAIDDMTDSIQSAAQKAQDMLMLAENEAKKFIIAAEREIVEIALAVAQKILQREIEDNQSMVLPIVKSALEKVRDQDEIKIRVNANDFDLLLQAKNELQIMLGNEHSLTIVADATVDRGSCVVDSSYGTVDARIDVQFETLKNALQGVLP